MQEMNNRVVIAGGTGFLGRSLAAYLSERGWEVRLLSRRPMEKDHPYLHVCWDGRSVGDWKSCLEGARAIVNLAGRSVDCVKTVENCDEILRSRVESTKALGKALRQIKSPPSVWVQMSTAHIYGDPASLVCDEDAALGYGLAPHVGKEWESSYVQSVLPSMKQVILRTSFVLGSSGGALTRLAKLVRWGLGGTVGSGKQGMSWIHEHDMNRLFERAIVDDAMQGVYIATAPSPVSNKFFMRALRRALGIPFGLPAFSWMVRLAAPLFLRTDPELALYGRYCVSKRLEEESFKFDYPNVTEALSDLFPKEERRAETNEAS